MCKALSTIKLMLVVGFITGVLLASSAASAEYWAVDTHKKGAQNISFNGSLNRLSSDNDYFDNALWLGSLNVNYGYFVANNLTIGAQGGLLYFKVESGDLDGVALTLSPFIKYSFARKDSNLIPYIGVKVTGAYGKADEGSGNQDMTGWGGGAFAGLEVMFNQNSSMFVEYNFSYTQFNIDGLDEELKLYQNGLMVGVSLYF